MEPLNEPLAPGVGLDALKAYYKASYDTVRNHSKSCYVIMSNRLGEHEPTELLSFASGFFGTVIDVHYYNIFEEELNNMSVDENIEYVRAQRSSAISNLSLPNGPLVFIGEWTAALNNASDDEAQKFAAAQLDVFGRASFGWAYSTYKNINNHWSLEWMINNGYITLNN